MAAKKKKSADTATKRGYSIRIYLPDGIADGLKIVEKSNWSGRGVVCPRALFAESKSRAEFSQTGIYILLGPSDSIDVPMIYVGQGDPVRRRLEDHQSKKDFWTKAVFFVSKGENLNKAHIGHLESRLIKMAKEANRASLDNQNEPALPSLSEMDVADAEGFLDEILLCLPVLGVTVFNKPEKTGDQLGKLFLKGKDASAEGCETPEGFLVFSGAKARIHETPSIHKYMTDLREDLTERKVLEQDGKQLRLTQDYSFSSPSTAAAVIMGRNANGRIEWKDSNGKTLKAIQEEGQLT